MSGRTFFVVGANHHNAPIEVRERLVLASEAEIRADLGKIPGLDEVAVLSTCNRVEFYGVGTEAAADLVQAAYCARQRFDAAEFGRIRMRLSGREAAAHLFEVAGGLDSQLVGENEIFGQVKDAYAAAQSAGTAGAVLNRVFQKAFQAAKHVRTHTAIAAGRVSVANVAVDLATNIFGDLGSASVLVLGTGEIGEGTAKAFRSRGAKRIVVSGRRDERARELAEGLGAATVDFGRREEMLSDYDVVVCSTAAPEAVVTAFSVVRAMKRRPARPLLLIDLAVPRDIETAAARLENVFLYNLDDLAKIAEANRTAREEEIARCRAILSERAEGAWVRAGQLLAGGSADVQGGVRGGGAAGQPAS
ncbi:MAG TPA: glutamyl-tRNA reductase [Opitutaceae bacterium]|jgi:glutamyl-tRNA reductase